MIQETEKMEKEYDDTEEYEDKDTEDHELAEDSEPKDEDSLENDVPEYDADAEEEGYDYGGIDPNSTEALVRQDMIDRDIGSIKTRGMFDRNEPCMETNCTYKRKIKKLEEKLEIQRHEYKRAQQEISTLKQSMDKTIGESKRLEIAKSLKENQQIRALSKYITKLQDEKKGLQKELKENNDTMQRIKGEHEQVMSSFLADQETQKKLTKLKKVDHQISEMQIKRRQTEAGIQQAKSQYAILAKRHDDMLERYQDLESKFLTMQKVYKNGATLKPLTHQIEKKTRNPFKRLFAWLKGNRHKTMDYAY